MDFPLHQHPDQSESEALARAIALSENEFIQSAERNDRASERLARACQNAETFHADEELVSAVRSSQVQHSIDTTRRGLNDLLNEQRCRSSSDRNAGRWDCRKCTYLNEPYATSCAACDAAAPPGILTYADVSPLRFGLEIELIVPNGKRDGFTLANLARQWNASLASSSSNDDTVPRLLFLEYTHETIPDWKIVPDASLQGDSPHDLCLELVSPVLQGEEGLHQLRAVMERLRSLGIATNSSCGFHVHVDATSGAEQAVPSMSSFDGVRKVARCFLALEDAFDLLVGLSWEHELANISRQSGRRANQNRYCQSNRIAMGTCSNRQRWDRISDACDFHTLVRTVCPDRYRKLNLTNIVDSNRPSTCEFRNHGGVEDLQEAEAWVRLLLRFCERASNPSTNDTTICLLSQGATPKDEVGALFQLLDCPGLEQYFRVERRLFQEERFTNPWKCRICHREFQTCRALSQHKEARNH